MLSISHLKGWAFRTYLVNSLEEQVNPKPEIIPEEDIPDVDLMELAKKIVAECPPPEGVELVYDTENVEKLLDDNPNADIDLSLITEYVRVYNPNPVNVIEDQYATSGIYDLILAKVKNSPTVEEDNDKIREALYECRIEEYTKYIEERDIRPYYSKSFSVYFCNFARLSQYNSDCSYHAKDVLQDYNLIS